MEEKRKTIKGFLHGRCYDKILAISRLSKLSNTQKEYLLHKYCNGRTGYSNEYISDKLGISLSTLNREIIDMYERIENLMKRYDLNDLDGVAIFLIDQKVNGIDWSLYTKKEN